MLVQAKQVKSILCKSHLPGYDFAANPYVGCTHACSYCYASFMRRFGGYDEPWGSFLGVKYWPEINFLHKYEGKKIFIGSVTDPYLPEEAQYERTRALLLQLQGSGAHIAITTKSDLILRDLDLIRSFPHIQVTWSINTLDESLRAQMDRAPSIERRIRAMATFQQSGVRTGCFIAPIFPALTCVQEIVLCVARYCHYILLDTLNLRGPYKESVLRYIASYYPQLWPLYEQIYIRGDRSYWQQLSLQLRIFAREWGLEYATHDTSRIRPLNAPPLIVNFFDPDAAAVAAAPLASTPEQAQKRPDIIAKTAASAAPATAADAAAADDFDTVPLFRH